MRSILVLALVFALQPLALGKDRGTKRKAAAKRFELRVENQGWKDASQSNLQAVYNSACAEIAVHFAGDRKFDLEPIRVRHDKSGPIVLFQRSLRKELVVQLSSNGTYWSQHAYQMAHEFCHILCRFKKGDKTNLWFEESLCEMASVFALRQMAITWKTDPPYSNWRSYGKALDNYAKNLSDKYTLPDKATFTEWFEQNREQLSKKATQRKLNGLVAMQLLPIFEQNPEAWQALPYINTGRSEKKQSFNSYIHAWHSNTPDELRPHIVKIAKQFRLSLE